LRSDALYLGDIVEAADAIAGFVRGVSEAQFIGNDLLRSAVLQKLSVIGEAAARVSQDLRHRHPQVEWADIVAFRNIAVHAYFSVQWPIVWVAATQDAPALRAQVAAILDQQPPDAPGPQ
jgi:uncharacterized protein with HEPN domain